MFDEDIMTNETEELGEWEWRLTPEYILYATLQEWNIIDKDYPFTCKIFKGVVNDFMDEMVKQGYLKKSNI